MGNGVADKRFGGSPVGRTLQARNRRHGLTGTGGDRQAAVERYPSRSPPLFKRDDQALVVLERASTVQNGDGWIAVQDAWYLACRSSSTRACCWASSLLRLNRRHSCRNTAAERTFLAHKQPWAARIMILDGTQPILTQVPLTVAAFDQRDRRALLDGFSRRHRGPPPPMMAICKTGAPGAHHHGFLVHL